jgi:hypothetical protein
MVSTKQRVSTSRTRFARLNSWLERPLSTPWCVLGWLAATVVFVTVTSQTGGLTAGDSNVSVYLAWSLAHGHLSCGFPPPGILGYAPAAPVYPLLSGAAVALLRIGHNVPFPTTAQLGPHCSTAVAAINHWALHSGAWLPTLRVGYLGWLVLMAGAIALLRSVGRGRCGWEPIALILLACAPPVSMCFTEYFHPQDLVALGLVLAALASIRAGRSIWAGIFFGFALLSQQFALLIFVPMLVIVPRGHAVRIVGAAAAVGAVVSVPLLLLTSGRAITSMVVGTGETSAGFSLLDETGIKGPLLFAISRILPIALAVVIAWWAAQELGPRVMDPIPLAALAALWLCFRLVFEVNVWGYYFMAVAVLLVLLDVIRGRIRVALVLWLALVAVAKTYGTVVNGAHHVLPIWLCQLVLVPSAIALASSPLLKCVAKHRGSEAALETQR